MISNDINFTVYRKLLTTAIMGETNASVAYAQPLLYKPMFGYYSVPMVSFFFTSQEGVKEASKVVKRSVLPVKNTRKLGKKRHEI